MLKSDLVNKINYLDDKYGTKILTKYLSIQNRKNLIENFPSEIKCILFLEKLFSINNLLHDSGRYDNRLKTPDWILDLDGFRIMIEVYNQKINEANLKKRTKAKLGQFTVLEIKEDRINKGAIANKYSKYIPLIKELNIPYYIFIEVDFLGDLDEINLSKFLYGPQYDDITGNVPTTYTDYTQGFYYSIPKSKYINGFFILKDHKITYYHNYNSVIKPSNVITGKLLKFQYIND